MTEGSIFSAAVNKRSPEERAAFLDEACAGNPGLRREGEALLQAHEEAGSFLQQPLVSEVETLEPQPGAGMEGKRRTDDQAGTICGR
ncbi:MAG TPA: hypothetical protein VGX70_01990 [Gemmataceae bacterium]|jgi:hypothetical protein|nr:hypothetical protein [Gemmataceae bacterium]